jgi:hypothetical protein
VVSACGNKVPQVREGTLNWIARAILMPKQIATVQKCVKPLANMLVNVCFHRQSVPIEILTCFRFWMMEHPKYVTLRPKLLVHYL